MRTMSLPQKCKDDEDWEDEENWYKVNPSLGYTVDIERLRDAYREAKQNPADEITFKWLRCNMWVSSTVAWIPDAIYIVAAIMALDRCIRQEGQSGSVYDERGLLVF